VDFRRAQAEARPAMAQGRIIIRPVLSSAQRAAKQKTDSAKRCQSLRPAKPQYIVIPDLIRNPELFSPARSAANRLPSPLRKKRAKGEETTAPKI
jgi:hypothetical protein